MKTEIDVRVKLSKRENEISQKLLEGLSNKQIACYLNISEFTVRAHRRNILEKTRCKNIVHLYNFLNQESEIAYQ